MALFSTPGRVENRKYVKLSNPPSPTTGEDLPQHIESLECSSGSSDRQSLVLTYHDAVHATNMKHETDDEPKAMIQKSLTWPLQKIKYKPLAIENKQIRLLRIHGGSEPELVQCTMLYTNLHSQKQPSSKGQIPYETISYCWGKDPGQDVIQLDGVSVQVTKSAEQVLRRMRYTDRDRTVWIDAICINQNDDVEKGAQVALMGDIYRYTWSNLVWLGDDDDGLAETIKCTLETVLGNIRSETDDYRNFYKMTHDLSKFPKLTRNGNVLERHMDIQPLKTLFKCRWFGRLWVAQEVAMPKKSTCHFGHIEFPLCDVLRVAVWFMHNSKQASDITEVPGLWKATNMWYLADNQLVPPSVAADCRSSLSWLYHLLHWMEASQPKDNIYALLGMWNPTRAELKASLVPKYDCSNRDLFRDATRVIIEESGSLLILQDRCDNGATSTSTGPSWAVQFDIKGSKDQSPRRLGWSFNAHNGQWLSTPTYTRSHRMDVLRVIGIRVATIRTCTGHIPSLFRVNFWPYLQEIRGLVDRSKRRLYTRSASEILAATLMAGRNCWGELVSRKDTEDFAAFETYFETFGENPSYDAHNSSEKIDDVLRAASRCFDAIAQACSKRRFFLTRYGRLGLGPGGMEDGDLVTVLYGGPVPVVLRRLGENRYKYIGSCYVHGVMLGEAIRRHKTEAREDIVFNIE